MRLSRRFLTVGVLLVLLVVAAMLVWQTTSYWRSMTRVLGEETFKIIEHPDEVRAYLLTNFGRDEEPNHVPEDCEVTMGPVVLTLAQQQKLAAILTNYSSFEHGIMVACFPLWGVKLQLVSGEKTVDIYLCFRCRQIVFQTANNKQIWTLFGPSHDPLLSLMKEIFPNVPAFRYFGEDRYSKLTAWLKPQDADTLLAPDRAVAELISQPNSQSVELNQEQLREWRERLWDLNDRPSSLTDSQDQLRLRFYRGSHVTEVNIDLSQGTLLFPAGYYPGQRQSVATPESLQAFARSLFPQGLMPK